ncbi:MAG TPA: ATP-binding protein, partial [Actinomycetota bacterium]|nr:ATP-binding protein [Actinomycetota bacterium]
MAWRRPEQDALRDATERLVSASTEDEVVASLLPHVTKILGARTAVLSDHAGRTLGTHGDPSSESVAPDGPRSLTEETVQADLLRLDFDFGSLVIWASPYTPFFGQEEVELLRGLGVLTGLALDRTQLYRREQEARAAAETANAQLQEANEGLRKSQAQLAEAQSIAHLGSFTWNTRDDSISWSDEMFRIYGVEPGAFAPTLQKAQEFAHPDDQLDESPLDRAIRERKPYSFDYRVVRPNGSVRTVHARGSLEVDEEIDEVVRVVGTVQDVTELREAERRISMALASEREARRSLEELNAEMESFVYTVSHDLNSPIIAIQGFSDFLSKDFGESLPEKGRFYIERIAISATYLQSLIKDLLQFSRIGRSQTEPEEVSLHDIVAQATDEIRAGHPGLTVEAADLPTVSMNPLRARQLFTNLMQNSCRYAGREDVRITISAGPAEGSKVLVSVRDNGPGIPKEHHKKVFGVFERLQQTGKTEGSGMGLPICKKIVETMGGSMWIEEAPDGLDVRFTLPTESSMPAAANEAVL